MLQVRLKRTQQQTRAQCRGALLREYLGEATPHAETPAEWRWRRFERCLRHGFQTGIFRENVFLYDALMTCKQACARYVIGAVEWNRVATAVARREGWTRISDLAAVIAPRRFGKTTAAIVVMWALCMSVVGTVICFFGNGMRVCQFARQAIKAFARALGATVVNDNRELLELAVHANDDAVTGARLGTSCIRFFPETVDGYVLLLGAWWWCWWWWWRWWGVYGEGCVWRGVRGLVHQVNQREVSFRCC